MQLFDELSDIFQLKKLKLKTQTKKTLLSWAKTVKFEERREKFHESCEPGKVLSKVGICKQKKKRPDWTVKLSLIKKTKHLRTAIRNFLDTLGILNLDPKTDIAKLAKTKHWAEVISLTQDALQDDKTKSGGAGNWNSGRRKHPYSQGFPHIHGQQTIRFPPPPPPLDKDTMI